VSIIDYGAPMGNQTKALFALRPVATAPHFSRHLWKNAIHFASISNSFAALHHILLIG